MKRLKYGFIPRCVMTWLPDKIKEVPMDLAEMHSYIIHLKAIFTELGYQWGFVMKVRAEMPCNSATKHGKFDLI